ncbi:hypothetical protein EMPS_03270 [Entomortierella parvispora]|uniref:Eisosome component PIL1-domain-containing protein n=1 Tax=Entomortierella parvispora TaxID=205924 RepID=A0A9P3H698_9FUNG|nr:hypothetical protein EMPS_03270 [Entomortierella parvispora]
MQSIGHDLRRGLNNINPLGNNYKNITKWLAEMKNIDSSLKTLDKEISADAKLIAAWGSTEGDDLTDVCMRMSQLMEEVGLIQQSYSLRHTQYRKTIKSMKVQEMTLDENRKKKQDLTNQIVKLQKSTKENPIKMMELQNSLERVTAELLAQELELMQFKRITIKQAFDAKFDAMLEFSEKMALIAGYGRAITLVIDTDTQVADRMRIYNGAEYTAAAVNQVKSAVSSWQPQPMEAPARNNVEPSQDELALAAAAAAYNNSTPRMPAAYAQEQAGSSNFQEVEPEQGYVSPPKSNESASFNTRFSNTDQISRIQEQERQLEQEQQRLYQQNLSSYSPALSPRQQELGAAGVGGGSVAPPYAASLPRKSATPDFYPPQPTFDTVRSSSPVFNGGGGGEGGYPPSGGYGHYDTSTYQSVAGQAPPRNYRLGFIDPRERSQMENGDVYKAEIRQGSGPAIPPLQFTNSPILDEK